MLAGDSSHNRGDLRFLRNRGETAAVAQSEQNRCHRNAPVARGSHPKGVTEPEQLDKYDRTDDGAGHRAEYVCKIEKTEAVCVAMVLLPHKSHHKRKCGPHEN